MHNTFRQRQWNLEHDTTNDVQRKFLRGSKQLLRRVGTGYNTSRGVVTPGVKYVLGCLLVAILSACAALKEPPGGARVAPISAEPSQVLALVRSLPPSPSEADLTRQLPAIMQEIARSPARDADIVRDAVVLLALQPAVVEALSQNYERLPLLRYGERLLVIQIAGALRRPDATGFLEEVIWKPLPPLVRMREGLSEREQEEIVQVKAVHGLAYLRTSSAAERTIRVILEHESEHVRREAIDAYLWNHGDTPEAARRLKALIPARYHAFVGMPRYVRGVDAAEFDRQTAARRKLLREVKP